MSINDEHRSDEQFSDARSGQQHGEDQAAGQTVSAEKSLTTVLHVNYLLQAISLFTGVLMIIAVIIAYIKQDDAYGTWLASHFRWQIRTFWWSLLWTVLGIATYWLLIGIGILAVSWLWLVYRIIKGWLRLNEGKAMYVGQPE